MARSPKLPIEIQIENISKRFVYEKLAVEKRLEKLGAFGETLSQLHHVTLVQGALKQGQVSQKWAFNELKAIAKVTLSRKAISNIVNLDFNRETEFVEFNFSPTYADETLDKLQEIKDSGRWIEYLNSPYYRRAETFLNSPKITGTFSNEESEVIFIARLSDFLNNVSYTQSLTSYGKKHGRIGKK